MTDIKAIAHRLTRRTGEQSYSLSETPIDSATLAARLINEIKPLFARRATKRYGRFADEASSFKGLVLNWLDNAQGFAQFTARALEQLAMLMEEQDLETDGHWLFAVEELEHTRQLWIVNLKQRAGLSINADNAVTETDYVDFSRTGLCARIDLNDLHRPERQRYLTLSFGFGDRKMQGALFEYFGFFDTVDTQADTERFMQTVEQYSAAMPEESAKRFQRDVAEFCMEQSAQGESVNYRELSAEVETAAEVSFDTFVAEQAPDLHEEFIPDRSSLKKYIRYTGRTKEISISFSNESLGKSISWDEHSETLTICELPSSLIKQLKKR